MVKAFILFPSFLSFFFVLTVEPVLDHVLFMKNYYKLFDSLRFLSAKQANPAIKQPAYRNLMTFNFPH